MRARGFNILSNTKHDESWRNCFGKQLTNLNPVIPDNISITHTEKKQITNCFNEEDKQNKEKQVNMNYLP